MTYVVIRLLAGSSTRGSSQEELIRIAEQELAPQLKQAGCARYNLIRFTDGRMGSVSRYNDRASAENGSAIAERWIRETGAMEGYRVEQSMRGETIFGHQPNPGQQLDKAHGVMRIYRTDAAAQDVKRALEQEAQPILDSAGAGIFTYTCIKLDGGDGYCVLTAHPTQQDATALTEQARQARERSGSLIAKVFPQPPRVIEGQIIRSLT